MSNEARTSVAAFLHADHDRLDLVVDDVLAYAREGRCADAAGPFRELEAGLIRHIEREEQVLFPAFAGLTGTTAGQQVTLRAEHVAIRRGLTEAAATLASGNATGATLALEGLSHMMAMHSIMEEAFVYAMVESWLDENAQEALMARMQALGGPR